VGYLAETGVALEYKNETRKGLFLKYGLQLIS